jgi:hypothetical protein
MGNVARLEKPPDVSLRSLAINGILRRFVFLPGTIIVVGVASRVAPL